MLPFIKYVVIIYNLLFCLLGLLIMCFSAYLLMDSQNYLDLNEVGQHYITPFIVLSIIGGLVTIFGFLGCCGAVRESSCLLGTYIVFCVTICVVCSASLFWVIHNEDKVWEKIKRETTKLIRVDYGLGQTNAVEMLVDRIQRDFECCGAVGPEDWIYSGLNHNISTGFERGIGSVELKFYKIPHSCCESSSVSCLSKVNNITSEEEINFSDEIYTYGCIHKFEGFIREKWQWNIIIGALLITIQIIALIFACILCCVISRVRDNK